MAGKSNKQLSLVLSARRGSWSPATDRRRGADFERKFGAILKRDRMTCAACGFQATRYQEVHHLNDDHEDNSDGNLTAICSFCHLSFHVGRAGLMGEAELIWLPEMSQTTLNHLARAIFVALRDDDAMKLGADALFSALRARADDARRRLGTSDPADLGEALIALDDADYELREGKLDGLRLLPLGRRIEDGKDLFPEMVDFWVSKDGPFAELPPVKWDAVLKRLHTAH